MSAEQVTRTVVDVSTVATVAGVLAGIIPVVASVAALIVAVLRIYEMVTGKPAKSLFDKFRR